MRTISKEEIKLISDICDTITKHNRWPHVGESNVEIVLQAIQMFNLVQEAYKCASINGSATRKEEINTSDNVNSVVKESE
jgi:hypothetical protein